MLGQLVPCGGGPPIALLKPRLLVGRHNYCDVPLRFGTVSGRHCELEYLEGYWFVRDLGSSNGTRVNGIICSAQRLLPNDVLSIAKIRFAVVYTLPAGRTPSRGTAVPAGWGENPPSQQAPRTKAEKIVVRPVSPSTGAGALGQLLPCGGGDPIPLHKPQLVAGRHADCDIVLPLITVSGRHCRLEWADGQWSVRDLGSRNGVRVDGVRCELKSLPPGSVLAIANLRFQVVYPPRDAEPVEQPSVFSQSLLAKAGFPGGFSESPTGGEEESHKRYELNDTE
jgi:adenylate cyclase